MNKYCVDGVYSDPNIFCFLQLSSQECGFRANRRIGVLWCDSWPNSHVSELLLAIFIVQAQCILRWETVCAQMNSPQLLVLSETFQKPELVLYLQ